MFRSKSKDMKRYSLILVAVVIGGAWTADTELSADDKCAAFTNCSCFKVKEYEIQCPFSKLDVVIHLMPDKYIQIDCYNQTDYKLDILPDVNIDVESFKVRFCSLPIYRFKSILEKFNVSHLKRLYLEECVFGNDSLSQIDSTFFEGLSTVETLSISSASKTFGEKLFQNLTNLMQLYLEQNKLTKIGYIFENNPKIKVLHLSRNSLKSLPDGVFKKLSDLQELHLWKNEITNITQNYFVGLRSLKSLELSINFIKFIEENAFSQLPELVNISLRANRLGLIGSNIFKHNPKMENIRIGKNPNMIISDYVFANLVNLKSISMDQCHLKDIPEHTFENCTNLTYLDMQNNRITNLPQNLFKSLKKLQHLNLSKNKLGFVPEKIFSFLENLEVLNLGENQLKEITKGTFEGLSKLNYLILNKNKISDIDATAFSYQTSLVELDLSYNQWVQQPYIFSYLEKLEQLLLSHNNISDFLDDVLSTSVNFKELDLSYNNLDVLYVTSLVKVSNYNVKVDLTHNNISYINFEGAVAVATQNAQTLAKADAFHNSNYSTTQVDISYNPLECDCNIFELVQYLKNRIDPAVKTFTDIKVGDMNCSKPKEFKHVAIKDLYPEKIICEYNSYDCPAECRCFRRPYDSAVIVDCSFKNLTQLPNITFKDHRIEVNMVGNFIERGPTEGQGYEMVKNLFLSSNKLKTFDWCPPYIEELKLDHNNLRVLNPNVLQIFNTSMNFSKLTLANNPWSCGCSALELQNFIKTHFDKIKIYNVICEDDKIPLIDKEEICKSKFAIVAQICIPILLLFLISATVSALYFRYKREIKIWLFSKNWCLWFVTEEELDKDKKYDIFLSFSHKDEDFILQNLVPSLEKSFKLCIHSRDWVPGELINDQIVDSVYNSRRTLVVLSDNFLESAWGKLEFLMAHKQSIEEGRPRVIVVKLGELNADKMSEDFKAYIKTNTYVEWGEPWFWKKLLYALPHSSKNASKTNQKHANMMLKIDDKFELVTQTIPHPDSTPPVISLDTTLLKKHPLNFSISSNINNFHSEVPLIVTK